MLAMGNVKKRNSMTPPIIWQMNLAVKELSCDLPKRLEVTSVVQAGAEWDQKCSVQTLTQTHAYDSEYVGSNECHNGDISGHF